ncbi:1027_t:CDS:2, partial [Gigaspora rosea]
VRKRVHIENNSTTSKQEEAQLNIKNLNNPSYIWHHFTVLEDKMKNGNIEDFFEVAQGKAVRKKQPIIEIAMLTWMIDDCQPLYLLRSQSFKSFMEVALPEFKVPSDNKARPPFYEATKMLLGVSYATLNMVCCTMHYLKKTVAPPNDQDESYYAELLYGELEVTASQSSSTNVHSDDEIVDLAGRVDQALSISHSHDPQYKKLKFVTETQGDIAVDKLNELYRIEQAIIMEELNDDLHNNPPKLSLTNERQNVNQVNYSLIGLSDDSDEEESNMSNEVIHYLALPKEALGSRVIGIYVVFEKKHGII